MMEQEAPDAIEEYNLNPFEMKVQGIDRTLADKVLQFAIITCKEKLQNILATSMIFISCCCLCRRMKILGNW